MFRVNYLSFIFYDQRALPVKLAAARSGFIISYFLWPEGITCKAGCSSVRVNYLSFIFYDQRALPVKLAVARSGLIIYYFLWPEGITFKAGCGSLSPAFAKAGDIKSHSSVCPSVCLSVRLSITKTLTLAITFALLQIELWYLACVFFVTRPFRWYHVVTLTVTFDLLQGQICCRAWDHNSLNLLVQS